jgi:hypothetical protein
MRQAEGQAVKVPFRGKEPWRRIKSRQSAELLQSPAAEPIQDPRPGGANHSDPVWPTDHVAVLAFLERWLKRLEPPSMAVPDVDLAARALELANADWPHQDAAEELARLADHDCQRLNAIGTTLVLRALNYPVSDAQAVQVGEVLRLAIKRSAMYPIGKSRRRY